MKIINGFSNETILLIEDKNGKHYRLNDFDPKTLWIENEAGEGIQITEDKFYELIDKFFKENF